MTENLLAFRGINLAFGGHYGLPLAKVVHAENTVTVLFS